MKKFCFFTVVNDFYKPFIPLFIESAKKAYPEYDIVIFTNNKNHIDGNYHDMIVDNLLISEDPYKCAVSRFLLCPDELMDYENVLITDIDIMIFKEDKPICEYHVDRIAKNGTQVYDNVFYYNEKTENWRCSGVHFVTREWWDRTAKARKAVFEELATQRLEKGRDEELLADVITKSDLPIVKNQPTIEFVHGIHLGAWRRAYKKKILRQLPANETIMYSEAIKDELFIKQAESHQIVQDIYNTIKNRLLR